MTDKGIRIATADDVQALTVLSAMLGYEASEEVIAARLQKVVDHPDNVLLVAISSSGEPVGFVHVGVRPLLVADRCAEICGLVVHSDRRGHGFGKRLMMAAEEWARRNDCLEVSLRSNVVREAAHEFYKQLGYSIYKTSFALKKSIAADTGE